MEPRPISLPSHWRRWLAVVIGIYALTLLLTRPDTYIDSFNYAKHIVDHAAGAVNPRQDPFWDFGHVLWRPMGYFIYCLFGGPLTALFHGNRIFAAAASLIVWNIAGALVAVVFVYLLAARLTGCAGVAAVAAIGFLSTHAVMNFKLTGNAYAAGIACQAAALYFLYTALQQRPTALRRSITAGALLGLSVAIWFPFVLPAPGYLCFALLWRDQTTPLEWRPRIRLLAAACVAAAAALAAAYLPAMAFHQIRTPTDLLQWVKTSRYGIQPSRGVARMLFTIPRGFLLIGTDNDLLKRLLLRTPGDPISLAGAVRAVWKPLTVYLFLAVLALRLRTEEWSRRMLACLAVAALPLLIFAAFLFDPSPPERYLGVFPLLFAAVALLLARQPSARTSRIVLAGFLGVMLAANAAAMWRFRTVAGEAQIVARLESVNRVAAPGDIILVPSWQDEGYRFVDSQPFHPASRFRLGLQPAVPIGSVNSAHWQGPQSKVILDAWRTGGQVWVSRRLLLNTPSPAWWIESDENRIQWNDVRAFYGALDEANATGGADGFFELARSPRNQALLEQFAAPIR